MQQVAGGVAAEVEAAGKRARVGIVCEGFVFQITGSGRRRCDCRPHGNPKPAIKKSAAHLRSG
jgi:hypothetical protein